MFYPTRYDTQIKNSLAQMVPAKKAELLEKNIKAIELGYNY